MQLWQKNSVADFLDHPVGLYAYIAELDMHNLQPPKTSEAIGIHAKSSAWT